MKTIVVRMVAVLAVAVVAGCTPGEANCLALAVCEDDEQQVDDCVGADDSCHEVTVCGTTIYCIDGSGDAGVTDGG